MMGRDHIDPLHLASIVEFGANAAERAQEVVDQLYLCFEGDKEVQTAPSATAVLRAARQLNTSSRDQLRVDIERLVSTNQSQVSKLLTLSEDAARAANSLNETIEAARRTLDSWSRDPSLFIDRLQQSQAQIALQRRIVLLEGVRGVVQRGQVLLEGMLSTAHMTEDQLALACQVSVPVSIRTADFAALSKTAERAESLSREMDLAVDEMIRSDLARLHAGEGRDKKGRRQGFSGLAGLVAGGFQLFKMARTR